MKMDLRYAWDTAQYEIFDARLRRGSHGDGIAVAAQPGRDPEDANFRADVCCRLTFVVGANAKLQVWFLSLFTGNSGLSQVLAIGCINL